MKVLMYILIFLPIIHGVFCYITEYYQKKTIAKLKKQIDSLAKYEVPSCFEYVNREGPVSVQLLELKQRAERLGFCFRCHLYQEKVQEDKQQNFETKKAAAPGRTGSGHKRN